MDIVAYVAFQTVIFVTFQWRRETGEIEVIKTKNEPNRMGLNIFKEFYLKDSHTC